MPNEFGEELHASDVFVSYKREERARILPLIQRLKSLGLTVWFDAVLDAGVQFDEEILKELSHTRVHLVCWTLASVESRWIRSEAAIGVSRNILLPVFLEPCQPRPPFNIDHAEDLSDWNGRRTHEGWLKVLSRIGQLTNRGSALRVWEEAGDDPNLTQLRAFISEFPNDPLTPGSRRRAFHLELSNTRTKLLKELRIADTEALSETEAELQRNLGSTREDLDQLRADSEKGMDDLRAQLSDAIEKLERSNTHRASLIEEFERQNTRQTDLQAKLNATELDYAQLKQRFDDATAENEGREISNPPPSMPTDHDKSFLVRWLPMAAVMAGVVSGSFMMGGRLSFWFAIYVHDLSNNGFDWIMTLGPLGATTIGMTAGASEVFGRAQIGPGRWLQIATREVFAAFYLVLTVPFFYQQHYNNLHVFQLGLIAASSFVASIAIGAVALWGRRRRKAAALERLNQTGDLTAVLLGREKLSKE